MSSTLQTAPPGAGPPRGLPRWAWVLIGLLAVIAIVAAAIAVFASRGRQVIVLPPAPAAPSASASARPTVPPSPTTAAPAATIADGCLGGPTELDRAVLTAQRDAPLTPAGAASFAATLIRWAFAAPAPSFQKVTAQQVLAPDVTSAARRSLSSTSRAKDGSTAVIDFTGGKYYIESFDGTTAIVSYVAAGVGTVNGLQLEPATVGGAVHLHSVNGTWHYQDLTGERSIEDLQRVGTPYSGGC